MERVYRNEMATSEARIDVGTGVDANTPNRLDQTVTAMMSTLILEVAYAFIDNLEGDLCCVATLDFSGQSELHGFMFIHGRG